MPLYEFECKQCKHHFEELVSSSAKKVEECPVCKGKEVRKLVSAGNFSGFTSGSSGISMPAPSCSPSGG